MLNDTYRVSLGDGADTITDGSGNDKIVFGAGIAAQNVTINRSGGMATLTYSATDSIRFAETSPGQFAIEEVMFADGTTWHAAEMAAVPNAAPAGSVNIGGAATQNQTLNASNTLSDADGMGAVSYQWQSSTDGATWTNIAGATSGSFTLTEAQVGKQVRVEASYTDGHGTAESLNSAATAAVANANDAPAGSVNIGGTATQNQTLNASNTLTDPDGMSTVSYQWQSSTDGATWTNIAGATSGSFTLTEAQVGKQVRVKASYIDGHGTAESVNSAATQAVAAAETSPATLLGTSGADTLLGTAGADTIDGLGGADTLLGGAGDDIYLFGRGSGADVIRDELATQTWVTSGYMDGGYYDWDEDYNDEVWVEEHWVDTSHWETQIADGGSDTLRLGAGISLADLELERQANHLVIGLRTSAQAGAAATSLADRVTLQNFFDPKSRIETLEFADGSRHTIGNLNVGGSGNDTLTAGGWLWGGVGNDILTGGGSADHLDGGAGSDLLIGSGGNDTYAFAPGGGADTIIDSGGVDQLIFGAGIQASGITASKSGSQVKLSVTATDSVTFEETAPGQYAIETVRFENGVVWQAADIQQKVNAGGAGNGLNLTGSGGADILNGQAGDDTLDGLGGADVLAGGAGNDTYVFGRGYGVDLVKDEWVTGQADVDLGHWEQEGYWDWDEWGDYTWFADGEPYWISNLQTVFQREDAGFDTLRFGAGIALSDLAIEKQGADLVIGLRTSAQDTTPTLSMADRITLKNFDDPKQHIELFEFADGQRISTHNWYFGGSGDDWYVVDHAGDLIIEGASGGTDKVLSYVSYVLPANVEHLNLFLVEGTAASSGTGNELDNIIQGNSAPNLLDGGAGNDTLDGGAGADVMIGGAGNDTFVVDNAGDVVWETGQEGNDTVLASISYSLNSTPAAYIENLTLTGADWINGVGNAIGNVITGNAAGNVLDGGAGADTLAGGGGDDAYVFGWGYGADTVRDELVSQVWVSSGYTVEDGYWDWNDDYGEDVWVDTSYWVETGHYAMQPVNAGTDTLRLGAGVTLSDLALEKQGADLIVGLRAPGQEHVPVTALADRITLQNFDDLKKRVERIEFAGSTAENLADWRIGTAGNDTLSDGAGNGRLFGGAGSDLLNGGAGDDFLSGDAGSDVLEGAGGNDTLSDTGGNNLLNAGAGSDTLTGGSGHELFIGGTGNDTITTGAGADIIAFNRGDGQDTVVASTGADNTLSLGGGIHYQDLALSKSSNHLVLSLGDGDQITLQNWFSSTGNRSIANLQIVLDADAYHAGSGDPLHNQRVQDFDFALLAQNFDQARAANPGLSSWSLTDALLNAHLSASDTAALGGDLAYQYNLNGSLAGIGLAAAQTTLNDASFGTSAQSLHSLSSLQTGAVRLG